MNEKSERISSEEVYRPARGVGLLKVLGSPVSAVAGIGFGAMALSTGQLALEEFKYVPEQSSLLYGGAFAAYTAVTGAISLAGFGGSVYLLTSGIADTYRDIRDLKAASNDQNP